MGLALEYTVGGGARRLYPAYSLKVPLKVATSAVPTHSTSAVSCADPNLPRLAP